MEGSLQKAQDSLGYMTITANRLMSGLLRRRFKEAGILLTAEQWGVLLCLWGSGPMNQEALCTMLSTDKSTMSRLLSTMESHGFIARSLDERDIRCKRIVPSDWANALKPRCMAIVEEVLATALEGVSREAIVNCLEVLEAVKQNLQSTSTSGTTILQGWNQ